MAIFRPSQVKFEALRFAHGQPQPFCDTSKSMSYLLVLLGGLLLFVGGDRLVDGASKLALQFGLTPYVIGLTVVAFGTSSPELAATMVSGMEGSSEMALGNVIGSNIANIGLILGITAIIYPLGTSRTTIVRELPLMLLSAILLLIAILAHGGLQRWHGAGLLFLLGLYIWFQLRSGRGSTNNSADELETSIPAELEGQPEAGSSSLKPILAVVIGIACLVGGAQALVSGAVTIAQEFGISDRVIGLTMLALGTSLPELASSTIAAMRRQSDMVLGGIIGSNVFNILAILGTASLVRPMSADWLSIRGDMYNMLAICVVLWAFMMPTHRLGRVGGAVLLGWYFLYTASLFQTS